MSSDTAEEAPAAAPAAPKAKTSKVVIALLVMNLGGTGFGVFKMLTAHAEPTHAAEVEKPKTEEIVGPVVPIDAFVVNLDEPGNARYLKLTIQVELVNHEGEEKLAKSKQVLRDAALRYLSGLHLKDTLGAQAKDTIRDALMAKFEPIIGKDTVRRMFFQEFVVQ